MASQGNEATTQSLYQQFLSYIKGSQKKQLQNSIQEQYKNLYSSISKSNAKKKARRQSTQAKEINMRNSGCRFTKISGGFRQFEDFKQTIINNQSVLFDVDQNNIENSILMQESQQKQLRQQIENYKVEIRTSKKNISQMKQKIKMMDLQQNKFMQVYQLATNIAQFTDQNQIINNKSYNRMLEQQQKILYKLKKLRSKAKQELAEAQHLYELHQRQHETKYKKLIKSCIPLQEEREQVDKKSTKVSKHLKKFMENIQKVLQLLESKQSNFQTIKQQQCTKLTNRKLNADLLPPDRIQWIKLVEQFEEKFNIRVQSSDKILVKLFKQIKQSNDVIEKRIFERRCLIQDYEQELKVLVKKQGHILKFSGQSEQQRAAAQKIADKKVHKIRENSITFVQIMQVTNGLLIKFRYIFKLFIMMNIDKRRLSDQILKLEEVLDKKGVLGGCRLGQLDAKTGSVMLQDTNSAELTEILYQKFQNIHPNVVDQILFLFFNDMRVALLCRKTMIMEQLHDLKQNDSFECFIGTLKTIQDECEYSYNEKLKQSLKLLYECLKCSIKTNSSANSSRSASTTTLQNPKANNIFESQLYLPSGMFPKTKIAKGEQVQDEAEESLNESRKWVLQFMAKNEQKQKPEQWGKDEKKNPSIMIRRLLAIRNESARKFKQLDLHECQKKYVKGTLKSMADAVGCDAMLTKNLSSNSKNQSQEPYSLKNLLEGEKKQKCKNNYQLKECPQYNNFIR